MIIPFDQAAEKYSPTAMAYQPLPLNERDNRAKAACVEPYRGLHGKRPRQWRDFSYCCIFKKTDRGALRAAAQRPAARLP